MSLYVTAQEFKSAPTSIDVSTLDQTAVGNQQAQDVSLTNILRSASGWVDHIIGVDTLEATTFTETIEANTGRDGRLIVRLKNSPIISLQSVQYRISPSDPFTDIDLTNVQIHKGWFAVYNLGTNFFNANLNIPIFYYTPWEIQQISNIPVTVKCTYVAGYMNTQLQSAATSGATTITVKDATGVYTGLKFTIYDGVNTENCTVQSVNGNVITLSSPLLYSHNAGVSVSAIPSPVKQATILLASYLIKERGSLGVMMNETVASGTTMSYNKPSDVETAKQLLAPFKRAVVY